MNETSRPGAGSGLPAWIWPAVLIAPAALWVALFFLGPLGIVTGAAFSERGAPISWTPDLSAWERMADPLHFRVLTRSFVLAAAATAGCVLLAFPLAWFIVRQPPARRRLLYVLVLLPQAANSLVLTYAWITILGPDGLLEGMLRAVGFLGDESSLGLLYTPAAVVLGLVYWYLPFLLYPLYASLEKFDPTLLDVARDLGASRLQAFTGILLPLVWPGLLTGVLLVFIQCFCSFVIPLLLGGGKTMLVGSLIQSRFLSRPQDWPLGAALALVALVLMVAAAFAILRTQRRASG